MKKLMMSVFLIVSSSYVNIVLASGWAPAGKVTTTYAHTAHGGYGVFKLSNMTYNSDNCANPVYYVVSKQNNPIFDEIYSLLLAAHMSGKNAQVWISGCSPHNHPEIQHARIVE